ncbi:MAG: signal peptidase I, partial [Actinomycetota bacterium]|nr:signal peptidase I [Actinomycetota bacterium]
SVVGAAHRPAGHRRGPSRPPGRRRRELPLWQEVILLLGIALVLAVVLKSLFVQAFYIPSASMHNTLIENDRILVEKPSYWFDGPERGDIVVFDDPGGWLGPEAEDTGNLVTDLLEFVGLYPSGNHLVKRVIGVGGDRVRCCDEQGRIRVDGEPLDESTYLPRGVQPSEQDFNVRVPEGQLWVMGDNRTHSADSRAHLGDPGGGFIPVDDVVGRVFVTVWPPDRAEFIDSPDSFESLEGSG